MIQRIKLGDKQYEVKRFYKRYPDSNENKLIEIKNNLGYEILIKNDQFYFLCNEIVDVEFVETTKEQLQNNKLNLQEEINSQTN